MLPRRLIGSFSQHLIGMLWRRLMGTQWWRPISGSPRRLKQVSNETPNDVSVVRHQDVSVVRIHNIPLVRLCDVFCNSQTKHLITSLQYVSTASRSYVFKLLCHDLHLVGFQVSFKHQIKHHIFLVPTRWGKRRVVWIVS